MTDIDQSDNIQDEMLKLLSIIATTLDAMLLQIESLETRVNALEGGDDR